MSLYDELGAEYDLLIDWPRRLGRDLPLVVAFLESIEARSVLDAACGTGGYARALAGAGYRATGIDISGTMIEVARSLGGGADFAVGSLAGLDRAPGAPFDAVLVLGNSTAHLLTEGDLGLFCRSAAAAASPGGGLLLQQRNYSRASAEPVLMAGRERDGVRLDRIHEPDPAAGPGRFRLRIVRYEAGSGSEVGSDELRGWSAGELASGLSDAGFPRIELSGDLAGGPFDEAVSADIVIRALR